MDPTVYSGLERFNLIVRTQEMIKCQRSKAIGIGCIVVFTMTLSNVTAVQRSQPHDEQDRSATQGADDGIDIEAIRSSYYGFAEIPAAQRAALRQRLRSDGTTGEILFYAAMLETSNDERMKLFERALAKGYEPAKTGIAHQLLLSGDVTEADRSRAIQLFEEAIAAGDPAASSLLGVVYADGVAGVERDPARAQVLLDQAVEGGFVKNAYRLVALHEELGDQGRADAVRQIAAEAGDVRALTDLGVDVVVRGEGGEQAQRGVAMLEKAAAKDYLPAIAALGRTLANGSNVSEADQARAKELTRRAALAGEPNAAVFLAEIYLLGLLGQDADPYAGLVILERLSGQDVPQADYILGIILLEGRYGQQVDRARARRLLEKAASAGNSDAARILRQLE